MAKTRLSFTFFATFCVVLAATTLVSAQDTTPKMHLNSGRVLEGTPERAYKDSVQWALKGSSSASRFFNKDISHIEFATFPEWNNALTAYRRADFTRAAKLFESIIANKPSAAFYPAPGNYVSRSQRLLLECYRMQGKEDAVASTVTALNISLLPPNERVLPPAISAWVSIANQDWAGAHKAAVAAEAAVKNPSEVAEIAFLRARAARKMGNNKEALRKFTQSSALLIGHDPVIGAGSLKGAAEMLRPIGTDASRTQLHAVLKEYANVYGGGLLWPGATTDLQEMLQKK